MKYHSRFLENKIEFMNIVRKHIAEHKNDKITMDVVDKTAYLSHGNTKLVSDIKEEKDGTLFLIWNIPARKTCPFATKLCSENCSAVKAETVYPDCLPCRERNFAFTKETIEFASFMIRALHYICNLKKYKTHPRIVIRVHESGDFYDIDYMIAWFTVAYFCYDIKNVTFMAYSKSIQYFDILHKHNFAKPSNFVFRYSIWSDTNKSDIKLAEKYDLPIYTAFAGEMPNGFIECRCEDCGHCAKCFEEQNKLIACKIH